jgi:hypothetical protein
MTWRTIGLAFAVIAIMASVFIGVFMLDKQSYDRREVRLNQAYDAWCKLTGRTDLSKDELYSLRSAGLLKGYYTVDKPIESK